MSSDSKTRATRRRSWRARLVRAIGLSSITARSWLVAGLFHGAMIGIAAAYHFPSHEIPFYLMPSSRLGAIELSLAEPPDEQRIEMEFTAGSPTPPTDVQVGPSTASIGRRQFVRSDSPRTAVELAQLPKQHDSQNRPSIAPRPTPTKTDPIRRSAPRRRVVRRPRRTTRQFVSVPMATAPGHIVSRTPDWSNNRPPEYPAAARVRGWQGAVELSVTVAADGRVSEVRITRSSGYAVLDAAAVNAVRGWRIEPPMIGSRAVAITTALRVRFELP